MLEVFILIFVLQIIFFIYAVINKTDKVTDLSYVLTFVIASIFAFYKNIDNSSIYKIVLLLLISIWGIRLSIYLFRRILKTGRDKRFDDKRDNFFKFGSFWLLQAVSIFIILLPTTYTLLYPFKTNLNIISYIGLFISLLGILIESIADHQKFVFKSKDINKGKFINTGIWKYSRHPNYLGEILMWFGIYIYCSVYLNSFAILTILSPIYITFLLVSVSGIPTLEKEYDRRYATDQKYLEYKDRTGVLFPKFF